MIKKILKNFELITGIVLIGFISLFFNNGVIHGSVIKNQKAQKVYFDYDQGQDTSEFIINEYPQYELKRVDGPYVVEKENSYEIINVIKNSDENLKLKIESKKKHSVLNLTVSVANKYNDNFEVRYKPESYSPSKSIYSADSRIIALSDIEGNFNALSSFLIANQVIDSTYNWKFGKGHLVLLGDIMDRGKNVTQCLWLIYKLEQQAAKQGGKVHFILGNHEAMNLNGNLKYVEDKYKAFIQLYSDNSNLAKAYMDFWNNKFVLGEWFQSENVIEKINNTLFVHGGISPELLEKKLSLKKINYIASQFLSKDLHGKKKADQLEHLIMGRKGPLWYRGLAFDYLPVDYQNYFNKIDQETLSKALTFYGVNQIVIGHTVVESITTGYDGRVIYIDVNHGQKKYSKKTKGILINDGSFYRIDAQGNKEKLKMN